ncbi:MAG: translational GTPase TypA [Proteobacteria bacterium]|nr:translational GTPase TypA [Pseudomonadota bacterium]
MSIPAHKELRNIAIIAHVDHGKTTLVDALLQQAGTFASHENVAERMMDSMDLERERGITIAAKNTAIYYKDYKINIVDTPGHSDFGGEVERILSMVDGAIVLVDAAEGPLPQTRFVLQKALQKGIKFFVLVNKVDRKDARPQEVINAVFNLLIELGAPDEQCDFQYVYAVAREGKAFEKLEDWENTKDIRLIFDKIIELLPPPKLPTHDKAQMLVANLTHSDYFGRLAIGRLNSGKLQKGQLMSVISENEAGENVAKQFKIQHLFTYWGLKQYPVDEIKAGDIAVIGGMDECALGDSIVEMPTGQTPREERWDPVSLALPRLRVDPPTLRVEWYVNNSPLAGREGEHVTSRKLRERLEKEILLNPSLKLEIDDGVQDCFKLMGRGELQMAILAETMRREGYEMSMGMPQILLREIDGVTQEPMELAILDIPVFSQGSITQMFQVRKGLLQNIIPIGDDRLRLEFLIPTRGLIGLRSRFLTETKGEGLFNIQSAGYEPMKGEIEHRKNGCLVSDRDGESNTYALDKTQERGVLFIGTAVQVYEGMIVGENAKENDLWVNVVRTKQLTNFRTVNKDEAMVLSPPRTVTIEGGLEWIRGDELLEITPKNIRLRKRNLKQTR